MIIKGKNLVIFIKLIKLIRIIQLIKKFFLKVEKSWKQDLIFKPIFAFILKFIIRIWILDLETNEHTENPLPKSNWSLGGYERIRNKTNQSALTLGSRFPTTLVCSQEAEKRGSDRPKGARKPAIESFCKLAPHKVKVLGWLITVSYGKVSCDFIMFIISFLYRTSWGWAKPH